MLKRYFKGLSVAMVLCIAAIASSQEANAGRGARNFFWGAAAGLAGLAVIDSLSRRRYYGYGYRRHDYYYGSSYYQPRPYYRRYRPRYAPRRAYRSRPAAWSPAWYRICDRKYRSFRSDGTFQPYKGGRRLCRL